MADYREISQGYAREGIRAAMALNGGAAIALLSQVGKLVEAKATDGVMLAMIMWAIGTSVAAFTWLLAFRATRYVDKSEREKARAEQNLGISNYYMLAGTIAFVISLTCFLIGSVLLAKGITAK